MLGALTDITERIKSQEELEALNKSLKKYALELERSNEELEQFAFITSHDMQEPLRMISSFMDQLKRKYGDQLDEKALEYIHYATDGARRMKQIILDLLEYSRANRPDEEIEEVDLNEILVDFQELRRSLISENDVSIKSDKLPTIKTYKALMTQIFHCLLDNAIKYSKADDKTSIELKVKEKTEEWVFSITDNGLGIDPEFHDKIFVIFQRLHNRDEYEGTGIGLPIAKRSVEFLGGKIWLESEVGKGTTFYFTIPKNNVTK
jgi:light-regulated signal transduction histidine kinase (bacteriophytochrome)